MLGGPGAGKGTQARRIAKRRGPAHISTGDMFRQQREAGTEMGQMVDEIISKGQLVPDEITCRMVELRLAKPDCNNGFVLDGFPRSLPQAEALEDILHRMRKPLTVVLEIAVSDEELVKRLTARRTCKKCGRIYNLSFKPPSGDPNTCDKPDCGGELYQRRDDKEETIRERLRIYHDSTTALYGFYGERGLLKTVPADGLSPDEVYAEVDAILDVAEAV
jgi:adenylate kinase